MKKVFIILLLGVLFLSSVGMAINQSNDTAADISSKANDILNELDDGIDDEDLAGLLDAGNSTPVFTTPLPSFLEKPARTIFRVKDGDDLSLEKFFVLICFLIIVFMVTLEAMEFSSLSESVNYVVALCITLLASISGQMVFVVDNFYKLTDNLLFFVGGVNKLSLFIILFAILILLIIGKILTRKFALSRRLEKAHASGSEVRRATESAKAINDSVSSNE